MNGSELRSQLSRCEWIFDFFAICYDYLSSKIAPLDEAQEYPGIEAMFRLLHSRDIPESIIKADGQIPEGVYQFLAVDGSNDWLNIPNEDLEKPAFLHALLALIMTLDILADDFSYFTFGHSRLRWPKVRTFLQRNHYRLNKDPRRQVILKPPSMRTMKWWQSAKLSGWDEAPERGQHYHRLFQNLCRVPELIDCDLEHVVIASSYDAQETAPATLRIAVVPLIDDLEDDPSNRQVRLVPGPLAFVCSSTRPPSFSVTVAEDSGRTLLLDGLCEVAERALRALAVQKTHVALFPELVVPDPVVYRIQQVLRSLTAENRHTPDLLLAGSFARKYPTSSKPYNEAILLNGRGDVLFKQRKMHAYEMQAYEQPKYQLQALFADRPTSEDLETFPRKLVFCDSRTLGYRITILICEDVCQESPGLDAMRAMRSSLVLAPVMAGALLESSGFHSSAARIVMDPGAIVIIGNSGGLPNVQWRVEKRPGFPPLGIVGSPLRKPGTSGGYTHLLSRTSAVRDALVTSIP